MSWLSECVALALLSPVPGCSAAELAESFAIAGSPTSKLRGTRSAASPPTHFIEGLRAIQRPSKWLGKWPPTNANEPGTFGAPGFPKIDALIGENTMGRALPTIHEERCVVPATQSLRNVRTFLPCISTQRAVLGRGT